MCSARNNLWLIIFIFLYGLLCHFVVLVFFYLGKEKEGSSSFINEICLKISQPDDVCYCLAVANKDARYCQNLDMPNQKKLCQGMATEDVC